MSDTHRLATSALHPPIEAAVLDGLGDVVGLDSVGGFEVGDGAADFEQAVESTGGEAEALEGGIQETLGGAVEAAVVAELQGAHIGVDPRTMKLGKARFLMFAGGEHPLRHRPARFARRALELLQCHRRDLDMEVDPVQQGPRDPPPVAVDLECGAPAFVPRITQVATAAPLRCLFAMSP